MGERRFLLGLAVRHIETHLTMKKSSTHTDLDPLSSTLKKRGCSKFLGSQQ
jgi:hypothetical protein